MGYDNYEDVSQLELNLLNELLMAGDPQERVWAAWQLGLRVTGKAVPLLSEQARNAPDPGTRRHMVVILAGLGHYSLIEVLAHHDPNPLVRATSCQYLLGTAHLKDRSRVDLVQQMLARDTSPEVRESILLHWSEWHGKIPGDLLLACVTDSSIDVRQQALVQLSKQYSPNDFPSDRLLRCLATQSGKGSVNSLSTWLLEQSTPEMVIHVAETAVLPTRVMILDVIADRGFKLPWSLLKNLADEKNPDVDIRLLLILGNESTTDSLLWCAYGVARALRLPKIRSRAQYLAQQSASQFFYQGVQLFLRLIFGLAVQPLASTDEENFRTIAHHLEQEANSVVEDDEEYWREEGISREAFIQERRSQCKQIESWIDSTGNSATSQRVLPGDRR